MPAIIDRVSLIPVKSTRAEAGISSLHVDSQGNFGDRRYAIVEAEEHYRSGYLGGIVPPGRFLSQRTDPRLATIQPKTMLGGIRLSAEGRGSVFTANPTSTKPIDISVWSWKGQGIDQGPDLAEWASDLLDRHVRVVATDPSEPRFIENNPNLGRVGFSDGYPFTVASATAYATVNQQLQKLGHPAVPSDRMRATFILANLEPPVETNFPEDYVNRIIIASRGLELVLRRRKASGRCRMPDIDQATGASAPQSYPTLKALAKLGRHGYHTNPQFGNGAAVFFSQNFIIESNVPTGETIEIANGAEIGVEYTDSTNWRPSKVAALEQR